MSILNISGYRFVSIEAVTEQQSKWHNFCEENAIKGTILLSPEGLNVNLAGLESAIALFKQEIEKDYPGMRFHEYYSESYPFKRLKVRIKKEIITFRRELGNTERRAPSLSPTKLKQWLDEKRDFTLLDTRNDYEVEMGTFETALNLRLNNFTDLPEAVSGLDREKPIVMFCTGGIRCEKAALYMQDNGFSEVYQLDGGILGYFAMEGGAHYQGGCFVFDERVLVKP